MKRTDVVRHLETLGGYLLREGRKHSVVVNPVNNQATTVPRHREINEFLVRKICGDLGIAEP